MSQVLLRPTRTRRRTVSGAAFADAVQEPEAGLDEAHVEVAVVVERAVEQEDGHEGRQDQAVGR